MKKNIFIIFAAILFAFNVDGQCNDPITQVSLDDYSLGPHNDTVYCYNDPVIETLEMNIKGGSGMYSYQWYSTVDLNSYYNSSTGTWDHNTAAWTPINGATDATYSPPPVTQSIRYKRVATDVNCSSLTRNDFSYVLHLYKVDQIESTQSTCSPSIQAASIIDKTIDPLWENISNWYTIQWEYSDSETGAFFPIDGATSFLFTPTLAPTIFYYRRSYTADVSIGGTCATQLTNVVVINPITCSTFSSAITGSSSVTPYQTSIYSVAESVDLEYVWTVWGGDIVSGQGTNTITVLWGEYFEPNVGTRTNGVTLKETDIYYTSNYTYLDVSITASTDINKGFGSTGISVFPNPIKNQFTIEMPTANTEVNYTVYSTTGVQMQSGSFSAAASGNTIATQLPAGMYQLVLDYEGVFTSTRLAVVE